MVHAPTRRARMRVLRDGRVRAPSAHTPPNPAATRTRNARGTRTQQRPASVWRAACTRLNSRGARWRGPEQTVPHVKMRD
jgi:hypothetical protein